MYGWRETNEKCGSSVYQSDKVDEKQKKGARKKKK